MWQNSNRADQKGDRRFQKIAGRIMASAEQIARDGAVVASWRSYRGQKLGPYWRIAFRDRGRRKSIYLGRSEALVQQVRRLVDELKEPGRRRIALRRAEKQIGTGLRRQKALWERELRVRGLYTRGYAVRGMRRFLRARIAD